jgi:hypothetical protein
MNIPGDLDLGPLQYVKMDDSTFKKAISIKRKSHSKTLITFLFSAPPLTCSFKCWTYFQINIKNFKWTFKRASPDAFSPQEKLSNCFLYTLLSTIKQKIMIRMDFWIEDRYQWPWRKVISNKNAQWRIVQYSQPWS